MLERITRLDVKSICEEITGQLLGRTHPSHLTSLQVLPINWAVFLFPWQLFRSSLWLFLVCLPAVILQLDVREKEG